MMRRYLMAAVAVLALSACDPSPVIREDDPRFNCQTMGDRSCEPQFTVSRDGSDVMIVTPDGVLLIIPGDGSCVRIAVGETEDAPCLPE